MKFLKRTVIVVSIILFVLLAFGSKERASTKIIEDNRDFVSFTEIEKEYLDSLKMLDWPEGTNLPTSLEGETADSFQSGYGDTRASLLWEYTWEKSG